ncbi:TonB-dependent receptor [Phenylobacterium sp.]|uniref:TonB-dependent receptor n=1 Tax=Phenylobacterium sp. TaxID=1871053 RepID=UPI0035AE6D4C
MRSFFISVSAVALIAASSAHAQTASDADDGVTIEPIVVTAQKRAENMQDVPVAISALSSKALEEQRVMSIVDLDNLAPGLRISSADAAANPKIFIRGVGLNDFNPSSSSGVGVYADGVYIGSPLAQMASFFDLERVEVLRGPQGTLYGRNTTGGAINLISKRPTMSPSGEASIEYGRFNSLNASAAYGGPIIKDVLAFRVAAQYVNDDGYSLNTYTGHRVNDADRTALRASLLYTPDDDTEVLAEVNRFINRGGAIQAKSRPLFPLTAEATGADGLCGSAFYYSGQCSDLEGYSDTDKNTRHVSSDSEGKDRVDLWSASLSAARKFGDLSLVSITAYQSVHRNDQENTDASPYDMITAAYINYQREFSQEFRLQSDVGPAKWVLGAYYMHDELVSSSSYDILRDYRPYFITPDNPTGYSLENSIGVFGYPYKQKTDSYAVFGQVDYDLTDKLQLSFGLRWSADDKTFHYVRDAENGQIVLFTYDGSKTFSDFSGRLGAKYQLTDGTNVYATYNRGYKSGGFFGGSADDPSQLEPYDNETVNAYEVGSKSDLLGRRLRMNLSAFYYDYQNIQAYSTVLRGGLTVQVLDNAASAEMYGAEAEFTATPVRGLDLSLGLGWLHAFYGDYKSEGGDYSGNRMPQAPKFNMTAGARYRFDLPAGGSITPSVDVSYRSKIYFDSTQTERLSDPELWLVDAQLAWTSPDRTIEAGLWGKNLTDESYLNSISPIDSLGVDLLGYAPPRTYGVFLRYRY